MTTAKIMNLVDSVFLAEMRPLLLQMAEQVAQLRTDLEQDRRAAITADVERSITALTALVQDRSADATDRSGSSRA